MKTDSKKVIAIVICVTLCAAILIPILILGIPYIESATQRKYNEITKNDVYNAFANEYPNAELDFEEHKLNLNKNDKYPVIGNYWVDLENIAVPEGFNIYADTAEDAFECLNILLSLFYDNWTEEELLKFKNLYFTDDNEIKIKQTFYFEDLDIFIWGRGEDVIRISIGVNKRYK